MSVRVDLQGIPADYFIDRESALGVMTGRCALLEYRTAGFSSRMRRGVVRTVPTDCRIKDFLQILRQGRFVFACSALASPRIRLRKNEIHRCKHRKNHRSTSTGIKSSLFIADIEHP
jgi:hypothetical protein